MATTNPEIVIFDAKLKEERDAWLGQLSKGIVTTSLASDHDRPASGSSGEGVVELEISGQLYQELNTLISGSPFLLYTTLMAAIKACLYRHTGNETIVVGSPALKELGSANCLVISDRLDDQMSFRQLLMAVRGTLLESYARQRYPIHRLLKDLKFNGAGDKFPLFDIAASLDEIHGEMADVNNDISIYFIKKPDRITGQIRFKKDTYNDLTIESFRDHIVNALREGVRSPEKRLCELELMAQDERHRMLVEWNETKKEYPVDVCLHELFEAQVDKSPQSIAQSFLGEEMTYGELNARANQLARRLKTIGVGPEVLVGICVERCLEMTVAILAALKAGAAFVPCDPTHPKDRLAYMLNDAGVSVLLTQRQLTGNLPATTAEVIYIDSYSEAAARESEENLPNHTVADNLAYVMYTSGSTGRPKGVMVTHRGLVNYLRWCTQAYEVGSGSGAPVHSPIGFDLTITGLLSPLLVGARILLVREDRAVQELTDALNEARDFSLVKVTPAHLEVLGQTLRPASAKHATKTLVVGGEALFGESLAFWREHSPDTKIINEYGPTETVVGCCVYEVSSDTRAKGAIPIGRPVDNVQLYILSADMQPVPLGVTGELYIGGDSLARGYLGQPDVTAEKFVPNPFSTAGGNRLYKTGDLARYFADGNIEFIGRADHQIKIRGFRIEPGEIEALLSSHKEVRDCVVIAREDTPGDKRLVAYVVSESQAPGLPSELRSLLREKLPDYMVPFAVVMLDELPLTQNGKIDRSALPAPDQSIIDDELLYLAPRNPVEAVLAGIWAEVLGANRVGVEDDFFELGGHSLLATKLASKVSATFQIELPLSSLFDAPTIANLTRIVVENEAEPGQAERIAKLILMVDNISEEDAERILEERMREERYIN
jgi:amino acid adenylation domain-containing protein